MVECVATTIFSMENFPQHKIHILCYSTFKYTHTNLHTHFPAIFIRVNWVHKFHTHHKPNAEVQFKSHQPKPPESVCSLPCEKGQAKKYVEGESCCWHCFNCSLYQVNIIEF